MTLENQIGASPVEESSKTAEDYIGQGWIYYAQKKYTEAEENFRRAILLDERLIDGHYGLGLSARAQGRTTEAIESIRKAQTLAADDKNIGDPGKRTILRLLIDAQLSILLNAENKES
jgi:tetratricopeptide (TPR) repeat protein